METVGNLLAHTFHLVLSPCVKKGFVKGVENPTKKLLRNNLEENNSNFQKKKKTLFDGQRLPTNFDRKPTIRNKIHNRDSKLLKQNSKGKKKYCHS